MLLQVTTKLLLVKKVINDKPADILMIDYLYEYIISRLSKLDRSQKGPNHPKSRRTSQTERRRGPKGVQ